MSDYEILNEKILNALKESKEKEYIIYPFGKMGLLTKENLNWRYGIQESFIVDNKLCDINKNIRSIGEVENKNDYTWLITCKNSYPEIVKSLNY